MQIKIVYLIKIVFVKKVDSFNKYHFKPVNENYLVPTSLLVSSQG